MPDSSYTKYASVAAMVLGSGLGIMAFRAIKRWIFWMLLILAIPCVLIGGAIYWYTTHGFDFGFGNGHPHNRFQSSLRVGMTESEVWESVEKHYPVGGKSARPSVLQNGTDGVGIFMDGSDGGPLKRIDVKFAGGRVVSVTEGRP